VRNFCWLCFCQEDWTDDDVGVIVESAATINARNMGSENSREFSQDSETTPGESVYSSDEEPDVSAQSRDANEEGAVYLLINQQFIRQASMISGLKAELEWFVKMYNKVLSTRLSDLR